MLIFTRFYLLGSLVLGLATSCHRSEDAAPASHCPEAGAVVKSVTDVAGTVCAEYVSRHYAIVAERQTSTSSIDVGIICDSLLLPFSHIGRKVTFSGTYHQRSGTATGDTTKYYLTVTKIAVR